MMSPLKNTLLALFLALKDLEVPLSSDEIASLKNIGFQLEVRPDAWELIEEGLIKLIEANAALKGLYQDAKSRLDAVEDISPELLPTQAEVNEALPGNSKREEYPWQPGKPNPESQEILNMAVSVLTTPDPVDTTKKLNNLERLKKFFNE